MALHERSASAWHKVAHGGRRSDHSSAQRAADSRGETMEQLLDRNLAELLQELRVAFTGLTGASATSASGLAPDSPAASPASEVAAGAAALRRGARVRRAGVVGVLLSAVSAGGLTAPSRSPPWGSLPSMGALQFWPPRARVSAATQGRRKCFGPDRVSGRAAEVCRWAPTAEQSASSDG